MLRFVQITDTPGLCDTHRKEEDILAEVGKSVAVASPGPHVVLMVLRCDRRFTEVTICLMVSTHTHTHTRAL